MAGPRQSQVSLHSRLRPFTSYKLRLKATNDIGDSDFSSETEAVTTLQDGKPLPSAASEAGTLAPRQSSLLCGEPGRRFP